MRIGQVIGRVCLSSAYETLAGGCFLIVAVQDRFSLAEKEDAALFRPPSHVRMGAQKTGAEAIKGGAALLSPQRPGGPQPQGSEFLVCYDHLGAGVGQMIAISESREACMPFYPEKRVPLDAYNAAILDAVVVSVEI